jgi:hypothetical protein
MVSRNNLYIRKSGKLTYSIPERSLFIEFVYQANRAKSAIILSRTTVSPLGSRFKLMPILDGLLSTIEQR